MQHLGDVEAAVEAYSQAIRIDEARPLSHYNLGVCMHSQGKIGEALKSFLRAAELDPSHIGAAYNIGVMYQELGELTAAANSYREVLEVDPYHADARLNYCTLLSAVGEFSTSERCYLDLLAIHPAFVRGMVALAGLYHSRSSADHLSAALELYRRALHLEPGNSMARHGAAALSGETAAELDEEYIRELFDGYSATFDESLATLNYRAPEILTSLLVSALDVLGLPPVGLRVLDLGAGTGLACIALRATGRVATAVGVDLSPQMLRRASALDCYNDTEVAEAGAFLANYSGHPFDVIIAADVLVYIPRLEELLLGGRRALSAKGLLAFTVELPPSGHSGCVGETNACEETGLLLPTGRYAHSQRYVEQSATAAGLVPVISEPCVPRMDKGRPIEGMAFVFASTDLADVHKATTEL